MADEAAVQPIRDEEEEEKRRRRRLAFAILFCATLLVVVIVGVVLVVSITRRHNATGKSRFGHLVSGLWSCLFMPHSQKRIFSELSPLYSFLLSWASGVFPLRHALHLRKKGQLLTLAGNDFVLCLLV